MKSLVGAVIGFGLLTSAVVSAAQAPKEKPKPSTTAEQYAAGLAKFARNIDGQVTRKLKAEQDYYKATADVYVSSYNDDILQSLLKDRQEQAEKFADALVTSHSSAPLSELRDLMRTQAKDEVESIRSFLRNETEMRNTYLGAVDSNLSSQKQVKTFIDALDVLATPKSHWDNLKDLGGSAGQINESYTKLKCADLDSEMKQLTETKKTLDAKDPKSDVDKTKIDNLDRQIKAAQKSKTESCS